MTSFPSVLVGIILVSSCHAITYSIELPPNQRFCFHQIFELNQKYSYVVYTPTKARHQVEVSHLDGRSWKTIYDKHNENQLRTRVDKLASTATTYTFCVKNDDPTPTTFKIQFSWGLEVMELHELPTANDGDNLDRELQWLDQQSQMLGTRSSKIQGLRTINLEMANMVGNKLVFFGIIGLLGIASVNFVFFRSLKKTFKHRKLI